MSRTLLVLSVMVVFALQKGYACDACGCSINGGGVGLLTSYNNNFVSLRWSNTRFTGVPGHGAGATDVFNNIELSVRYHLTTRFKVQFVQAYRFNTRKTDKSNNGIHGIADMRILGSYTILKNLRLGERTKIFFEIGAGVQLPVGKYNENLLEDNLPENFNTGNGSWGYLFQPNLLLTRKNIGVVLNGNFQFNEPTKNGYEFGNQYSSQVLFFWDKLLTDDFSIMPNAGVYYEKITKDRYFYGDPVPGTGGKGTYFSLGLNIKHQKMNCGFTYSLPFDQYYSDGAVDAKGRMNFQLSYLF